MSIFIAKKSEIQKVDSKNSWLLKVAAFILLSLYAIFALFPVIWLLYNSLKTNNGFLADPFSLPDFAELQWSNFVDSWVEMGIGKFTLNSFYVTIVSVSLTMIISAMAAFAIKRMIWKGSNMVLNYILLGIMIPIQTVVIPLFLSFRDMNLLDSRNTLVLPYIAFALPTSVFILTGFLETIPRELEEAAFLDGCSVYGIFVKIILPLSKPAFITIGVFNFIGVWNELILALVLLSKQELMTLPVGLLNFRGMYGAMLTKMFAAIVVSIIPSLLIYFSLQEKITKGVITGAVKG